MQGISNVDTNQDIGSSISDVTMNISCLLLTHLVLSGAIWHIGWYLIKGTYRSIILGIVHYC